MIVARRFHRSPNCAKRKSGAHNPNCLSLWTPDLPLRGNPGMGRE